VTRARFAVLLVAAGEGRRFGGGVRKALVELAGRPLLAHSLERVAGLPGIEQVILVVHPDDIGATHRLLETRGSSGRCVRVVPGGRERFDSVRRGLAEVSDEIDHVLVHDAARPLVPRSVVEAVMRETVSSGAAAPGVAVKDTVKRIDAEGFGVENVPRDGLVAVQTPQGFRKELLARALRAWDGGPAAGSPTDETQVVERFGARVAVVPGAEENLKITTPFDLAQAEAWLRGERKEDDGMIRTGFGWDSHRLEAGGPLRLGGIDVPFDRRLVGHSDADVVLHALCDALLGAAGRGDIGEHFPDTDERHRGADSRRLVESVAATVRASGLRVRGVDLTVVAERPKLGSHKEAMRRSVAGLLGIPESTVNVKAKTAEGLGPVGEGRSIEAFALVTLAGAPASA
jgi:2-C-methyl-D-erythritol 4-phosphate cytidylyltransferase/2-C-methyl-D-erythritol 2,4-cyclodiphosphate synthase